MLKRFLPRWSVLPDTRPEDVFTPFSPATLTYVERPAPEAALHKALAIPGMQVLVCGAPGSGKTTLLQHVLHQRGDRFILTRCFAGTTLEQVMEDGFEQFRLLYSQQHFCKRLHRPLRLTLEWLGRNLGRSGVSWVVEDVQYLRAADRRRLQQSLKHYPDIANSYPRFKIILVYCPVPRQVLFAADAVQAPRLMEVTVPLFTMTDLEAIIEKGEQLLNIVFNPGVRHQILGIYPIPARYCHQRCLALCLHHEVQYPQKVKRVIDLQESRTAERVYMEKKIVYMGDQYT